MLQFPPLRSLINSADLIQEFKLLQSSLDVLMTDEANKNKANYVASNETLKTAIANTYTLNSFERFIGEFYTFWAIRDNLCRTKLVSDVSETNNKSFNYFIMAPSDGSEYQPVFFQLNRYKLKQMLTENTPAGQLENILFR